ncbi:protein of unknown function [Rhodovastum atsumiense]|nr:protein of unknown function [Rhodovastum atsumiense]
MISTSFILLYFQIIMVILLCVGRKFCANLSINTKYEQFNIDWIFAYPIFLPQFSVGEL